MSKTAIIFPGQGAQYVGMGKDLLDVSDQAAAVYRRANEVLGFDLAQICFEGPADRLEATDIQQPAILVTSMALWSALIHAVGDRLKYSALAGLSLGEYTALYVAEAVRFEDAVTLVYQRGQYMQEAALAQPSGMVSILGMEVTEIETLCREVAEGEVLELANFNCPGQIVVSGHKAACERAVRAVEMGGKGKAVVLKVAGAFHSALMKPAAEKLKAKLSQTKFSGPKIPVVSNVDVQSHDSSEEIKDVLYRQVFHPVRWQASIEKFIAEGFDRFIEVGPGRSLSGMMRKIDRQKTAINVSHAASLQEMIRQL